MRRPSPLLDRIRPDPGSVWLFLLSVTLAVAFWSYTVSEAKSVKDVSVPLQFVNVPKDFVIVGEDARSLVTIEFMAPPDMLKRVREEDIDLRIDTSKLKPGPQAVELTRQHVSLPSFVTFVRAFPKVAVFSLDRKISDSLPLRPAFTGRPPSGLQVVSWSIVPPTVLVGGPESILRQLNHISTQSIPLDGQTGSFETPVVPTFSDPNLTAPLTGSYTLNVVLGEKQAQRTLAGVPVRVLNAKLPVIVQPETIKVMVEGPASLIKKIVPGDLMAEVDARRLEASPTPYQLRPAVRLSNEALSGKVKVTGWVDRFVSLRVGQASEPPPHPEAAPPGERGGVPP